jgi:hypothetical protein
LDESGLVSLIADIVPENLEEMAMAGAEVCPQRALVVEFVDE